MARGRPKGTTGVTINAVMSRDQVALELGISTVRVAQIESNAIAKIKKVLFQRYGVCRWDDLDWVVALPSAETTWDRLGQI
jgi:hypothetical protein